MVKGLQINRNHLNSNLTNVFKNKAYSVNSKIYLNIRNKFITLAFKIDIENFI